MAGLIAGIVASVIGAVVVVAVGSTLIVRQRKRLRQQQRLQHLFSHKPAEQVPHLATAALVRASSSGSTDSTGSHPGTHRTSSLHYHRHGYSQHGHQHIGNVRHCICGGNFGSRIKQTATLESTVLAHWLLISVDILHRPRCTIVMLCACNAILWAGSVQGSGTLASSSASDWQQQQRQSQVPSSVRGPAWHQHASASPYHSAPASYLQPSGVVWRAGSWQGPDKMPAQMPVPG